MEGEKKSKNKFLIALLVVVIILGVIGLCIIGTQYFSAVKKAVVVMVNDNSLGVMELDSTSLYNVSFADDGNIGFKQGQEILIFFDGIVAETFPAQIHHVKKIKIVKEKSDISIPENILRYYYSSPNNITISVSALTETGISFTIKDTNKIPYEYPNTYTIYKKNKEIQNTTIDVNKIIPGTENSTSAYIPDTVQTLWQEVPKISNIASEDTGIYTINDTIWEKTYNWSKLYGKLSERRI